MVNLCNIRGKPVFTGSQLLETMQYKKRPTRAETTDVANAVLDGCDGLILTRETAIGLFPIDAIITMKKIIIEAERCIDRHSSYLKLKSLNKN